jgi:hypothetical protein
VIPKGIEAEAKFENRNTKLEGQEEARLETRSAKGFGLTEVTPLRCEEKSLQAHERKGVKDDCVGQRSVQVKESKGDREEPLRVETG